MLETFGSSWAHKIAKEAKARVKRSRREAFSSHHSRNATSYPRKTYNRLKAASHSKMKEWVAGRVDFEMCWSLLGRPGHKNWEGSESKSKKESKGEV